MGQEVLSNRQRKIRKKAEPKLPKTPKGEAIVKVAKDPLPPPPPEPSDRDGLLWLAKKKRLTGPQVKAALRYRDLFRALKPGGSTQSCLMSLFMGGGGGKGGGVLGGSYGDAQAQLDLIVIRSLVLRSEPDMLTVMDGVCGLGHTVRYLAGGEQLRAVQLEQSLRIALNLLIENDESKAKALAQRQAGQARAA